MKRVEIRIDFRTKGFCLFVDGEAIGYTFRRYKFAVLAQRWLQEEFSAQLP